MAAKRKSSSFLGHTATYAVANLARRLVGFVMLPIYTRYLTPADYGVIGLMMFTLALFEPVFGARLGVAVPKFYFDVPAGRPRRTVIWGALGLTSAVSILSMVALIFLRGIGSEIVFGESKYALALGVFAVNLVSRPVEDTGMLYLQMHSRSRLFLVVSTAKLLMQVALNVLLVVYFREGVLGVVVSGVISSTALGLGLMIYVAVCEAPAFDWRVTRRMLQFCWPLWFSGLAGLYTGSAGGMYLRILDNLSAVGRLELALRFAAVVGMVIWTPFIQHWGPLSYRYFKEPDGPRKFRVAFVGIAVALFLGGLGISIFAEPAIRLMATRPFYAAAAVVPILTFGFVLNSLRWFFNFSFLVTEHTKVSSVCHYITAVVMTVAYLILVPRFGLMGAAVAQCFALGASFVYTRIISRRYYDPGFNLGLIGVFSVLSVAAYLCANVLLPAEPIMIDLLIKSVIWLAAAIVLTTVGVRAIRTIDASALVGLPWPLDKLSRLAVER